MSGAESAACLAVVLAAGALLFAYLAYRTNGPVATVRAYDLQYNSRAGWVYVEVINRGRTDLTVGSIELTPRYGLPRFIEQGSAALSPELPYRMPKYSAMTWYLRAERHHQTENLDGPPQVHVRTGLLRYKHTLSIVGVRLPEDSEQ
jgi:hypothetical protein